MWSFLWGYGLKGGSLNGDSALGGCPGNSTDKIYSSSVFCCVELLAVGCLVLCGIISGHRISAKLCQNSGLVGATHYQRKPSKVLTESWIYQNRKVELTRTGKLNLPKKTHGKLNLPETESWTYLRKPTESWTYQRRKVELTRTGKLNLPEPESWTYQNRKVKLTWESPREAEPATSTHTHTRHNTLLLSNN